VVYSQVGKTFERVEPNEAVPFGRALWVLSDAPRVVAVSGLYPGSIDEGALQPSGSGLHAWPRLEPFDPAAHASVASGIVALDPARRTWLAGGAVAPAPIADLPPRLGAASVLFSRDPLTLDPS